MGLRCYACRQPHHVYRCPFLLSMVAADRWRAVNELRLCTNCLKLDHFVDRCPSRNRCGRCGLAHNTMLHVEDPARPVLSARSLRCLEEEPQIFFTDDPEDARR